mgnify:CR=1 FL=1
MARMQEKYKNEAVPKLQKKFNYANVMETPKFVKIVVNMGVGESIQDKKLLDAAIEDLEKITGQKALIRKAKKSISNFKLRAGMPVGAAVTLRGNLMYEFMDRFFNLAIPRIRDFKGMSATSFDGRGNYTCGVKEQIIFPEIEYDKVVKVRGMDITFVTTAKTDEEAKELMAVMGFPFKK